MSATTVRVLIGSVIAACVLGIGALEVVSERVHVDPASTVGQGAADHPRRRSPTWSPGGGRPESGRDEPCRSSGGGTPS